MSRAACIIAPWESLLHEHSSYTDDASPNSKLVPAAQLLTPILTLMQAWVRALQSHCALSVKAILEKDRVQAGGTDGATCLSLAGDSH